MPKNKDNDAEPSIVINLGDEDFEITPHNATLFTFLGRNAMYNHVFVATAEQSEEGIIGGAYIFSHIEGFNNLAKMMRKMRFPAVINQPEVAQCDMEAFDLNIHHMAGDVEQGVPEGWDEGR